MSTATIVTIIFLFSLVLKLLVKAYLDYRNVVHLRNHYDRVPDYFIDKITLDEHHKAIDYSKAKTKFSWAFAPISYGLLLYWTLGGGLNLIQETITLYFSSALTQGLSFFGVFIAVNWVIGLPESLLQTFYLEEKFGFNKTTLKTFVIDQIKAIVLSVLIGGPLLAGVLWIVYSLGDWWWVYAWGFVVTIQFLLMAIYPKFIAPLFNKFSPLEDEEKTTAINELLEKTNFKSSGLFVMDASKRSSHGNAYFTGFGKTKRIVFFDTLLEQLSTPEMVAVLAHELGHFKLKHILKRMAVSVVTTLIGFALLGKLASWAPFFQGHGIEEQTMHGALLLFSLIGSIYTFWLTPLSSWWSRQHEFQADHFAAQHSEAKKLISALIKLFRENASPVTIDPVYSSFYYSHPPAFQRIEELEKMV